MSALREVFAAFGIEVESEKLDHADEKIEGFIEKLKQVGALLIGGEVAKGIFDFAENLAQTGNALDKGAIRLGITTDSLQELGFAASESGSDVEGLSMALLQLQDRAGDAMQNVTGENAKAFAKLGFDVTSAAFKAKDSGDLIEEVAGKIAGMNTQAEKVTTAVNLFGRAGRNLLPFLDRGKEGIEELRAEFRELGGGFSKEAVKASKDFHEAGGRFGVVTDTIKGKIAVVLLPWLQKGVDFFTKLAAKFVEFAGKSHIIETTLAAIGLALTIFAVKSAAAFGPFLLTVAAVGLALLALEDVVSLFSGDKSLLGEFIDGLAGAGASATVAAKGMEILTLWWRALKAEVLFVVDAVRTAIQTFEKLYEFAQKVGIKVATAAGLDTPEKRQEFKQQALETAGNVAGKVGNFYGNAYGAIGQGIKGAAEYVSEQANKVVSIEDHRTFSPVITGSGDKQETLRQLDEWWEKTMRQQSDSLLPIAEPAQ